MESKSKVQTEPRSGRGNLEDEKIEHGARKGWQCPVCGKILSPTIESCPTCIVKGDELGRKLLNG